MSGKRTAGIVLIVIGVLLFIALAIVFMTNNPSLKAVGGLLLASGLFLGIGAWLVNSADKEEQAAETAAIATAASNRAIAAAAGA